MPYASPHASPTGSSASMEDHLRYQIEELRASTREEMLKSWAEVEQIQREKEEIIERNLELASQLRESKEAEEDLRREVAELKKRLGDSPTGEPKGLRAFMARQESRRHNSQRDAKSVASTRSATTSIETSSTTEHSEESTIEMSGMSLPSKREGCKRQGLQREGSLRFSWPNRRNSAIEAEKERMETEMMHHINEMEREKAQLLAEMRTKVVCRDSVLQSMEHAQRVQGESLDRIREEMKEHVDRSRQREDELQDQIHGLKKKLKEKRKVISDQQTKLKEFQWYVDDLSSRLERVNVGKKRSSIVESSVLPPYFHDEDLVG